MEEAFLDPVAGNVPEEEGRGMGWGEHPQQGKGRGGSGKGRTAFLFLGEISRGDEMLGDAGSMDLEGAAGGPR